MSNENLSILVIITIHNMPSPPAYYSLEQQVWKPTVEKGPRRIRTSIYSQVLIEWISTGETLNTFWVWWPQNICGPYIHVLLKGRCSIDIWWMNECINGWMRTAKKFRSLNMARRTQVLLQQPIQSNLPATSSKDLESSTHITFLSG